MTDGCFFRCIRHLQCDEKKSRAFVSLVFLSSYLDGAGHGGAGLARPAAVFECVDLRSACLS